MTILKILAGALLVAVGVFFAVQMLFAPDLQVEQRIGYFAAGLAFSGSVFVFFKFLLKIRMVPYLLASSGVSIIFMAPVLHTHFLILFLDFIASDSMVKTVMKEIVDSYTQPGLKDVFCAAVGGGLCLLASRRDTAENQQSLRELNLSLVKIWEGVHEAGAHYYRNLESLEKALNASKKTAIEWNYDQTRDRMQTIWNHESRKYFVAWYELLVESTHPWGDQEIREQITSEMHEAYRSMSEYKKSN